MLKSDDVDTILKRLWHELRNFSDNSQVGFVQGAVYMSHWLGELDENMLELWLRRIKTCPGHDDEGGRDWCAYCGKMNKNSKQNE